MGENKMTDTPETDHHPALSAFFRRLERKLTAVAETLKYWRDISECVCSDPLPNGGCLRCDLDKILNEIKP